MNYNQFLGGILPIENIYNLLVEHYPNDYSIKQSNTRYLFSKVDRSSNDKEILVRVESCFELDNGDNVSSTINYAYIPVPNPWAGETPFQLDNFCISEYERMENFLHKKANIDIDECHISYCDELQKGEFYTMIQYFNKYTNSDNSFSFRIIILNDNISSIRISFELEQNMFTISTRRARHLIDSFRNRIKK